MPRSYRWPQSEFRKPNPDAKMHRAMDRFGQWGQLRRRTGARHLAGGEAHDRSFVRVDGDLPVDGNGNLAYLHLGKNGSVWAAIMEKAWAFLRSDSGTYQSIEGTWPSEPMAALHGSVTLHDVSAWNWQNGTDLLKSIQGELQAGHAVCYSTPKYKYIGPVVGQHAYTVDHVNCDANGNPTGRVLRNPWGIVGAGSAGSDDGYVTLTPTQAWAQSAHVSAAAV